MSKGVGVEVVNMRKGGVILGQSNAEGGLKYEYIITYPVVKDGYEYISSGRKEGSPSGWFSDKRVCGAADLYHHDSRFTIPYYYYLPYAISKSRRWGKRVTVKV